ncbi:hypothetical protein QP162_17115 [Sphingomonas aurantiaca]
MRSNASAIHTAAPATIVASTRPIIRISGLLGEVGRCGSAAGEKMRASSSATSAWLLIRFLRSSSAW